MMNLIIIPFHDWRKSESEGFRTRDVHFVKSFEKLEPVNKILVVNRPFTRLELLVKKHKLKLAGELVFKNSDFSITKVSEKIFVLDYESKDFFNQILQKHKWFFKKYGDKKLVQYIEEAKQILNISNTTVISQNIFAYKLLLNLKSENKLFDAWDNFSKFPAYSYIKDDIQNAYLETGKHVNIWATNSEENKAYFKEKFDVQSIHLIKNGVNENFANECLKIPRDIAEIPKPIIGFGGKISYLLDTDLINYVVQENPRLNFVFVGQILNKEVFNKIKKTKNIFFLGDKNYSIYPCYVNSFDVGIIPYKIKENQHGGDSIKAYEYLQAGIKVVGTKGNGLLDLEEYLYLASDNKEFSDLLKSTQKSKKSFEAKDFSWRSKAETILALL